MYRGVIVSLPTVLVVVLASNSARAQFDLIMNSNGFTSSQQVAVDGAEMLWEDVIAGYQDGISLTGININIAATEIDGPGGILGQAGPTGSTNQGGFSLSTSGAITIDSADISSSLGDVVAHEIGHILGIGTQWTNNGVYVNGTGQYTGTFGLNAYQLEYDPEATFIPVELDGGGGTRNAHWDESGFFADELMSGYLSGSAFLSDTTVASLIDLGFDTIGGMNDLTGVDGDVNQDGFLTSADVDDFVDGWLSTTIGLNAVERTMLGDLDLSGLTDLTDAFLLHEALVDSGAGGIDFSRLGGVPEPSSFVVLGFGAISLLSFRRTASDRPTVRRRMGA